MGVYASKNFHHIILACGIRRRDSFVYVPAQQCIPSTLWSKVNCIGSKVNYAGFRVNWIWPKMNFEWHDGECMPEYAMEFLQQQLYLTSKVR